MIDDFIAHYTDGDESRIVFAWNGKHGDEFVDANYSFRRKVFERVLAHPERAPVPLIRDLFLAETRCSKEAWGIDRRVGELASLLLYRGGVRFVEDYLEGKFQSMDASMAASAFTVTVELASSLLAETERRLAELDLTPQRRRLLELGRDMFAKWVAHLPGGVGNVQN